jgi:hypothetical protein
MAVSADPELGQVLHEQKPNRGNIGNCIFLMILGLPFMLVVLAPTAPWEVKLGLSTVGFGLSAFAAIMLWRNWMYVFLQERGIREYRQGKPRSLHYDEVATLFYTSGRIFSHGSYVHTVQKLALQADEPEAKPLVCTHIFREPDGRALAEARTPLTQMRDVVARRLADRLLTQVRRGEAARWSDDIQIGPDGLLISPGVGREDQIAWSRIHRIALNEGVCQIEIDDDQKPRWKIKSSEPNFWPALVLVQRMRSTAAR